MPYHLDPNAACAQEHAQFGHHQSQKKDAGGTELDLRLASIAKTGVLGS